jgi:plasmid maintenance system antidote protein VapI
LRWGELLALTTTQAVTAALLTSGLHFACAAEALDVSRKTLSEIVNGHAAISPGNGDAA